MSFITFKIDDSKAVAKIKAFEGVVSDMTPVYRTIGAVLVRRINLCFKLGIDPFGNPWTKIRFRAPRLSAKTGKPTKYGREQIKANAAGNPGQPLRDTGRLQRSITSRADSGGVTVGTNLIYARTHQFGAEISPVNAKRLVFPGPNGAMIFAKKVTIPARPFMPIRKGATAVALPPSWAIEVLRALRTYLAKATEKATA